MIIGVSGEPYEWRDRHAGNGDTLIHCSAGRHWGRPAQW